MTASTTDRAAKIDRLHAIMAERSAAAISLTSPASLSWLLDGARVSVPYAGPAVCAAVVDSRGEVVVTALSNERERLRLEELPAGVQLREVAWFDSFPPLAKDVLDESQIAEELRAARAALLPGERSRYVALGAEVTRAVGEVLRAATPDETEHHLASRLVAAVVALGAEPVVTLVAGRSRDHLPHPLPTAAPLGRRAMAVVGARRGGLVVNLTRWISFGIEADAAEQALRDVEADAYAATSAGRALRDVLADIADAYERHGFGADAWRRHHQGGPTGYLGRDPKVTPDTSQTVVDGQAFAWNPWVPGAKCEDTMILDADGWVPVTVDPDWPTARVRGIPRPLTLEMEST